MQYLRKYRLLFGKPQKVNFSKDKNVFTSAEDLQTYYENAEKDGYVITDHQITFNIQKQATDKKKTSQIEIINLSDDVVNYLIENNGKNLVCMLEAGYEDEVKQIFRGTITKVLDNFDTQDRKTTLNLGDGVVNIQSCLSSRSYPRGTSYDTAITNLISDLGISKGVVDSLDKTFQTSKVFHGQTSTLLKRLAEDSGYRFSIQDHKAYFVKSGVVVRKEVAKLTADTGLLGTPKHGTIRSGKKKKTAKDKEKTNQYKIECLLDGAIIPETAIYVESRSLSGWFKVVSVAYKGDYRGGSWMNAMECQLLEKVET